MLEALKAATLGDLHLVHDLVDRVRSHGPALIESLEKTPPLRISLQHTFS